MAEVISGLLSKLDISREEVEVSCEYGKYKADGSLYQLVMETYERDKSISKHGIRGYAGVGQ